MFSGGLVFVIGICVFCAESILWIGATMIFEVLLFVVVFELPFF
jgi:hypothetical protein